MISLDRWLKIAKDQQSRIGKAHRRSGGRSRTREDHIRELDKEMADDSTVPCMVCGKRFPTIQWTHLKFKHNMTSSEYKEKFPKALMTSEKTRKKRFEDPEERKKISLGISKAIVEGRLNLPHKHYKSGFRTDLGHHCRTLMEANCCRVLIYRGWKYEYEKHRFDLGYTTDGDPWTYVPDLYIPSKNMYIEIKGRWRPGNKEKCKKFQALGYKLRIIDPKKYKEWNKKYSHLPHWNDAGGVLTKRKIKAERLDKYQKVAKP